MAEYIGKTKGFGTLVNSVKFNTYVPELSDNADIQNAFELFYFGDSTVGTTTGDVSLYGHLLDFDTRITSTDEAITGHAPATFNVHGATGSIVGTTDSQTLTNKTLTTPKINENVNLVATSTELNYVDGVTSPIQTQLNTNTPVGMISIHAGSSAPTGWLLCDGTSYSTTTYANLYGVIGYTFGGSGANFNVPNLKGKVVVGIDAAQAEFDTRGETGGAMTHQHAASNSGSTTPTTSGASDGNTTGGASAGNTTGGASAGNTTSNNSSNHTHSVNPGTTATTSAGTHNHTSISMVQNVAGGNKTNVMDDINAGSHDHDVNIAAFDSGAQSSNHTHNTADHSHDTADHTHSTTDHSHTVAHSHTTPLSDTLSNLQPYMALNYIIKF